MVTLVYSSHDGRDLPTNIHGKGGNPATSDLYWRYQLRQSQPDISKTLVLWERWFKNELHTPTPEHIRLLGIYINPSGNEVVVLSRNLDHVYGDVSVPGVEASTNLVPGHLAYLRSRDGPSPDRMPESTIIARSEVVGTYDAKLSFRDGGTTDFVFSGIRWKPKPGKGLQNPSGIGNTPEQGSTVVFDHAEGTNRVVCLLTKLDDQEGWRMATNTVSPNARSGKVFPFDRKYQLILRSSDPSKNLILWEKGFAYDIFHEAAAEVGSGPDLGILGYHIDAKFQRAVVFYRFLNMLGGEISIPGKTIPTNQNGVRSFVLVESVGWSGPPATSVVVSPGAGDGQYHATVFFGGGQRTNTVFDGKVWSPERIILK